MGKEIIVNNDNEQTRIAIVDGGELVELFIENPENERTLGDIFLARVRKIMPSIQAAFVDIGQKQDAFLHFSDLSDNLPELLTYLQDTNPEVGKTIRAAELQRKKQAERKHPTHASVPKQHAEEGLEFGHDEDVEAGESAAPEAASAEPSGPRHVHKVDLSSRNQRHSAQHTAHQKPKPQDVPKPPPVEEDEDDEDDIPPKPTQPLDTYLKRDQRILVKIVKEPISAKGSRVSTDISLAGRFLVLVPLANYVAVSKKIVSYKERRRLRTLAKSLVPEGFGVIVRTVADGKNAQALDTDLRLLVEKWRKIERKLQGKPEPPLLVHEDVNMVSSIMRDLFTDDYDRILVDDLKTFRNLKSYVQAVAPDMSQAVQQYRGSDHIFAATKIAKDAAQVFESRVDLPTGGYLFIERTEAMHVVDVNSGRSGRGLSQEENSLKVNLEAARVIAKQIRLRDLGGIIVVDFIDLRDDRNRMKVYDELKREFRKDRAVTKLLPMSDFGLVQITRQRLRPSVTTTFADSNSEVLSEMARQVELKENEENAREAARRAERPVEGPRRNREDVALAAQVSPEALIKKMEEWVAAFRSLSKSRSVTLRVHPFMGAYLNRKLPNYPTRWTLRYFTRIQVELDDELSPFAFRFLDRKAGDDVTDLRRLEREKKRAEEEAKARQEQAQRPAQAPPPQAERGGGRGDRPQGRSGQGRPEQGRGEGRNQPRPEGRNQPRGEGRGQVRPERPQRGGEPRPQPGEGRNQPRGEQRGQGRPDQRGPEPRREERGQPRTEESPRAEGPPRRDERGTQRGEQRREPRSAQPGEESRPRGEGRNRQRPARSRPEEDAAALPPVDRDLSAPPDLKAPRPDFTDAGVADTEALELPLTEGQDQPGDGEQEVQRTRSRRRNRGRGRGRRRGKGTKPGAEGEAGAEDAAPEDGAPEGGDEDAVSTGEQEPSPEEAVGAPEAAEVVADEKPAEPVSPPAPEPKSTKRPARKRDEIVHIGRKRPARAAEASAPPQDVVEVPQGISQEAGPVGAFVGTERAQADEPGSTVPESTAVVQPEPAGESGRSGRKSRAADEGQVVDEEETMPVGAMAPLNDIGPLEMFGAIEEPTAEDFRAPVSEPVRPEEQEREGDIGPLDMFGPLGDAAGEESAAGKESDVPAKKQPRQG